MCVIHRSVLMFGIEKNVCERGIVCVVCCTVVTQRVDCVESRRADVTSVTWLNCGLGRVEGELA